MIFTRMALDADKRRTTTALSAPSIFHGAVERSFDGERKRNLWRIDKLNGRLYLMILSEDKPNLTEAARELGFDGEKWESKDYSPLLKRITDGSVWRFRLCANPTRGEKRAGGERGKTRAHSTAKNQTEWLIRQGEKRGFNVSPESFGITQIRWYSFFKGDGGKKAVKLLAVTYEGVLTVSDSEKFTETLLNGVGRGKAYGMGLLTIAGEGRTQYV